MSRFGYEIRSAWIFGKVKAICRIRGDKIRFPEMFYRWNILLKEPKIFNSINLKR